MQKLLAALVALSACKPSGTEAPPAPRVVHFYNFAEYMDPQILSDFEKKTGTKVVQSFYESTEEMLAKLQHAAGAKQYDLAVVSHQAVPGMVRLGVVRALDPAKLPNLKNLAPRFAPAAPLHSVAYLWGTVGLLYDKKKHPALEPSWAVLFDAKRQVGPFLLIDELRDQLGVALIALGLSPNSANPEDLKRAGELLLAAKQSPHFLGFEGGVGAKNRVVAGTADLAIVWNGDAVRAIREDADGRLAYVVPKEGSLVWVDQLVVTSGGPNPDGAHALIDYLLEPEVGARLSNFNRFATPNAAAMPHVDKTDARDPALYPSPEVERTLVALTDPGEARALYDEVWTAVKAR